MKHSITVATAAISLFIAGQASAQNAALPTSIQVEQPGDGNLSCADLKAEIARMDQMGATAQTEGANAQANVATTGAIASAATSAALYSGALGRSFGGFGGMLAGGAQSLLGAKQSQQAQQTASLAQNAQMRRTRLMGIYQGKACDSAQPVVTPVSAPAPANEAPPSYAPAGAPSYAPAGAPRGGTEAPGG
jgi:hypothetical protein